VSVSVGSTIYWNIACCYTVGSYVPSLLCIWPIKPNPRALRNLCAASQVQLAASWIDIYGKGMVLQAEAGTFAPPMTNWLSSILYSGGRILTNGTGASAHLHPWLEAAQRTRGSSLCSVPGCSRRGWRKRHVILSVIQFFQVRFLLLCWHLNLECLTPIMCFNNLTVVFGLGKSALFTLQMKQQILGGSSYHQGCRNINTCRAKLTAGTSTHNAQSSERYTCLLLKWTWPAYFLLDHYI